MIQFSIFLSFTYGLPDIQVQKLVSLTYGLTGTSGIRYKLCCRGTNGAFSSAVVTFSHDTSTAAIYYSTKHSMKCWREIINEFTHIPISFTWEIATTSRIHIVACGTFIACSGKITTVHAIRSTIDWKNERTKNVCTSPLLVERTLEKKTNNKHS